MLCNFACNSLTALSNLEFAVLEFQRFQMLLTLLPIELHATLGDGWPCWGEVGSWGVTFLPCSACCRPERDKTRPARAKHTKFGAFVSAGRILSRTRPDMPRAGRRMSRLRVPQLGSQAMRRPSHQPRWGASECLAPVISHVIPWRLLQTLNSRRCNCNVCGQSPKVTAGNYVRFLSGLDLPLTVGMTSGFSASAFTKMLVAARRTPDREDSTSSDRVESSR